MTSLSVIKYSVKNTDVQHKNNKIRLIWLMHLKLTPKNMPIAKYFDWGLPVLYSKDCCVMGLSPRISG